MTSVNDAKSAASEIGLGGITIESVMVPERPGRGRQPETAGCCKRIEPELCGRAARTRLEPVHRVPVVFSPTISLMQRTELPHSSCGTIANRAASFKKKTQNYPVPGVHSW